MSILDRLRKKFTKPSQLSSTQRIGDAAEERALQFLKTQGLTLLQRNFRCRGGEIDLIMQEHATLVFVEVRQRSSRSHGGALVSVTPAKQKRLLIAAQLYLQRYQNVPACRFDVVAYDGLQRQWIKNAIEAQA
ncbi:putative endonuclease [Herbaspirillum sp. Sphag1AN]|uniref:YraN family protein n=1 Tax=unclassified Herbaspirillum TaxID=2624150 RepID=UPI00161678D2|nr:MULTISPECIES: YraN family protein [unclassified Herbaspirillum]MBB3213584.1 putative endonuclease [Herbaspirillum sp. Sphag1AN]MBB3246782.1 putative endonuclease [Herbaspirillum sp. Sphag64]